VGIVVDGFLIVCLSGYILNLAQTGSN